jgi:hypothetical protein
MSANQVLGPPNAIPVGGFSPLAWTIRRNGSFESEAESYITVAYDPPMRIQQVAVFECGTTGAVKEIHIFDPSNNSRKVYEATPLGRFDSLRTIRAVFPLTRNPIYAVKVKVANGKVNGWNQIDAIGISAQSTPIQWPVPETAPNRGVAEPVRIYAGEWFQPRLHPTAPYWIASDESKAPAIHQLPGSTLADSQLVRNPFVNQSVETSLGWSADGQSILATQGNRFCIARASQQGWHYRLLPLPALPYQNPNNQSEPLLACLTADAQHLIVSAGVSPDNPEPDLWRVPIEALHRAEAWVSLGNTVNTIGRETSPYLAADNRTLYFASTGHAGYGDFDLYVTTRLDDTWTRWSPPLNLGPAINTPWPEVHPSVDAGQKKLLFQRFSPIRNEYDFWLQHLR